MKMEYWSWNVEMADSNNFLKLSNAVSNLMAVHQETTNFFVAIFLILSFHCFFPFDAFEILGNRKCWIFPLRTSPLSVCREVLHN